MRSRVTFIVVLTCATLVKLWFALTTVGANDMLTWTKFVGAMHQYGGLGVYYTERGFNHPPLMIHMLGVMDVLARWSSIPFPFWLRLPAILADIGTILVVGYGLARVGTPIDERALPLCPFADREAAEACELNALTLAQLLTDRVEHYCDRSPSLRLGQARAAGHVVD